MKIDTLIMMLIQYIIQLSRILSRRNVLYMMNVQCAKVTKLSMYEKGPQRSDSSKTLSTSITWKAVPEPDPDLGRRRLEMKLAMAHEEMKSGKTRFKR